jgi:nitrite reductase/ring-hydroxylating ferredoxin subunit
MKARPENAVPRWVEDFPVDWERDQYISRRELARFLTLGSALLAGASAAVAAVGRWWFHPRFEGPALKIAKAAAILPGSSLLFRYPSEDDPCILLRGPDGRLFGYSQVCTHLSCAVVYQPEQGCLLCPCHHGWFDAASGMPIAGPPRRPLPRILLNIVDDTIIAVGRDV